jgi:integrase
MPWEVRPRWVERDEAYVAPLGPYDEKRRRYRDVVLKDDQGRKVRRDDQAGKAAALAKLLAKREAERKRPTGPTVADIVAAYLQWHRDQRSAERTIADRTHWLTRFGLFEHEGVLYCDRQADSIKLVDLTRVRKAMQAAGNDDSYIRQLYMSVRACFAWAAKAMEEREPSQLLKENPFHELTVPSAGGSEEKYVEPEVTVALIEWLNRRCETVHPNGRLRWDRFTTAFKLTAYSGCRPSEAAGLRWSEIHWRDGAIVIPARQRRTSGRRHKTGKKTGKPRVIDIPADVLEKLKAYHADPGRHEEYVFWTGSRPTGRKFGVWFSEARELAKGDGIGLKDEHTLYWFRHTWQTIGVGVASVERIALASGNSPQIVSSTYVSARIKDVKETTRQVVEAIEAARKGASSPTPSGSRP